MPVPREGESQQEFVSRCIPVVMSEPDISGSSHAAAKCYGIFRQHGKAKSAAIDRILSGRFLATSAMKSLGMSTGIGADGGLLVQTEQHGCDDEEKCPECGGGCCSRDDLGECKCGNGHCWHSARLASAMRNGVTKGGGSDCGANAPGGGGFQLDNTCAVGGAGTGSVGSPLASLTEKELAATVDNLQVEVDLAHEKLLMSTADFASDEKQALRAEYTAANERLFKAIEARNAAQIQERRERVARLGDEYAAVKPRLEELVDEYEGQTISVGVESWEDVDPTIAEEVRSEYISAESESNYDYATEQIREKYESDVRDEVEHDQETLQEAVRTIAPNYGINPDSADQQFLEGGYSDRINPDAIEWEDGTDSPSSVRWKGIEKEFQAALDAEVDGIVSERLDELLDDSPEEIYELASEMAEDAWNYYLSDDEKMDLARDYGYEITGEMEVEAPRYYRPFEDGLDYDRTRSVSRVIQDQRAREIMNERGISAGYKDEFHDDLWSGWKQSSTSDYGKALQLAATDELGALSRPEVEADRDYIINRAIGKEKYEAIKAYTRATWEASQYVLDKAGENDVTVWRGVMVDSALLEQATKVESGVGVRLPDLALTRNGAQSTTSEPSVANSWNGIGDTSGKQRVVIRVVAPRESVISLPVFGQNIHEEQEIILSGNDDWIAWDAWQSRAPSDAEAGWSDAELEAIRGRAEPRPKTFREREARIIAILKAESDCGANAPGGGGFQAGNTCAEQIGGARQQEMSPTIQGEDGKRRLVNGQELPPHIPRIPPAWTDVSVSEDPDADLLVKGRDGKGRLQSVYSENHAMRQAAIKFARVRELIGKFPTIEQEIVSDLADPDRSEHAAALDLIRHTGLRPGSDRDTKAKRQAFGATTLEGRHVIVDGDQVRLEFVGKSGKDLSIDITDNRIASDLIRRKQRAGDTGKLFNTSDDDLREYASERDGGGFKTKDFRTARGTLTAIKAIRSLPKPATEKEYKSSVKSVAKLVSSRLGNTPTIALQSYIDPTVFSEWRQSL